MIHVYSSIKMEERNVRNNRTAKEDASLMVPQRRHFAGRITLLQDAGQKLKALKP